MDRGEDDGDSGAEEEHESSSPAPSGLTCRKPRGEVAGGSRSLRLPSHGSPGAPPPTPRPFSSSSTPSRPVGEVSLLAVTPSPESKLQAPPTGAATPDLQDPLNPAQLSRLAELSALPRPRPSLHPLRESQLGREGARTAAPLPGPPPTHGQSRPHPRPSPLTSPSSPAPFRVLPAARAAVRPHSSDMSPRHCGGSGEKQTRSPEPAPAAESLGFPARRAG